MTNKQDYRALSEDDWLRLADILGAPADRRAWLARRIAWYVECTHQYRKSGAKPVHLYAGKVAEPLEDVVKLARELEKALAVLIDERNVDAWGANPWLDAELRRAIYLRTGQIEEGDCIELYRRHVSSLADAAGQAVAKVRAEMQERGPQPGMKHARQNYDPQLCHFVTRIAFDALRAGARATGDEAGTLIPLLEELRAYLPPEFLPPIDDHPCRSYQRMIERAREAWTKSAPQIPGQTQH